MRLELRINDELQGVIEWDQDTGSVEWLVDNGVGFGPTKDLFKSEVAHLKKKGFITLIHPGVGIPCTDPLRNPSEFAALISTAWDLPQELEAFFPVVVPGEYIPGMIC
jgi:hypothetical protein